MGVSAYQLASSTQAAVASASRGFHFVGELAQSVGEAVEDVGDVTEHGLELARHATRGAIHGMSDHPGQVRDVSRGAVLGTIRSLAGRSVPARHSLRGAGYGAVQGAVEGGEDPSASAAAALGAARELAAELGVTRPEAAAALASGAIEAATASGGDALIAVRNALPDEFTETRAVLVED